MGCFWSKADPKEEQKLLVLERSSIYSALARIRPFDLIVFRGADCVSGCIRCMSRSEWSHCGIVVNTRTVPIKNGVPGRLYLWESTIGGSGYGPVDVETCETFLGTQFRDLESVVKRYLIGGNTRVAWYPLRHNPLGKDGKLREYQLQTMRNLYNEFRHQVYQLNVCYCLGAILSLFRKLRVCTACCTHDVFCSQLVAIVYVAMGVLPADVDPQDVTPGNFVDKYDAFFKKGVELIL